MRDYPSATQPAREAASATAASAGAARVSASGLAADATPGGSSPVPGPGDGAAARPPEGFVTRWGGRYYRIPQVDELPVFFMNIPSASDLWLFVASNGALSAGRRDADQAIFPYQPVDRIYDSVSNTGAMTACRVSRSGGPAMLWEPLVPRRVSTARIQRALYKSIEGDRVWFEEINHELQLAFRFGWTSAGSYGLVRTAELENLGDDLVEVRLLDGFRNLLMPGITRRLQEAFSCLADAYKQAERVPDTTLALYALASGITDRPVPLEVLRSTVAWSDGLPDPVVLLSDQALGGFFDGAPVGSDARRRGVRASYLTISRLSVAPRATHRWCLVADTGRSQTEVVALQEELRGGGVRARLERAVEANTQRLRTMVGAADGCQSGGDERATAHHFANVLFNLMRGGAFAGGAEFAAGGFVDFVRRRNRPLAERRAEWLASLPPTVSRSALVAGAAALGDPDLERLALEHLPLMFSRRHGDPSRPWNHFAIRVGDDAAPVLHHEGNWRDIFQNWEALGVSYPDYLEAMIATFLNASTIDGYNGYRLTRDGIEWEIPNPDDPWSSIGYWGDHQTVYLLRLLEWAQRFHPGRLARRLRHEVFSFAAVPYRISTYEEMHQDPRHTIRFDAKADAAIGRRVLELGTDGRLLADPAGGVRHASLVEKLLLLVLVRLVNFVPGAGLWMNTQRPEWNDANNALVGAGASVVTLGYLRRFLVHLQTVILPALGEEALRLPEPLARLNRDVLAVLDGHATEGLVPEAADDAARRSVVDGLGAAGTRYRADAYANALGEPVAVPTAEVRALVGRALAWVDHSLRANRRGDGLYHAYNLIEFVEAPAAEVRIHRLAPMLEGQVAILSSGLLAPGEALEVLQALRRSPLYRKDQDSYLLYPDGERPGFLARGAVAEEAVARQPLLRALLEADDRRVVQRDRTGGCWFHPDLTNAAALESRLAELEQEDRWTAHVRLHRADVGRMYEEVFRHQAFTGRSGAMFGYEGLGCIYWHMVAKLLLAVQENLAAARAQGHAASDGLSAAYASIRGGLGVSKPAAAYGAFPTDPYSHTPGHAGAQQPGMTGQVKEEILTRWGELGVEIAGGCLSFAPERLRPEELTREPSDLPYLDATGALATLRLGPGSFGFTYCGTPVVYRSGGRGLQLGWSDGRLTRLDEPRLDRSTSLEVFGRTGRIRLIEVNGVIAS